jgi:hypothetical protein
MFVYILEDGILPTDITRLGVYSTQQKALVAAKDFMSHDPNWRDDGSWTATIDTDVVTHSWANGVRKFLILTRVEVR